MKKLLTFSALFLLARIVNGQIPDSVFQAPEGTKRIDTVRFDNSNTIKYVDFYSEYGILKRIYYPPDGSVDVHTFDNYGQFIWWGKWYSQSQIADDFHYQHGHVINGTAWYPDGRLKQKAVTINDTCVITTYYSSGVVQRLDYEVKGRQVHVIYYCENGLIAAEDFVGKEYGYKQYRCDGSLIAEGRKNREGQLIGIYREWNSEGKMVVKGNFIDCEKCEMSVVQGGGGKKDGKWKYYNEEGKLIRTELYKSGQLISTKNKRRNLG
jgi:antitoxin component YwqK of YwqJK toxin-antitoxin module